MFNDNPNYFVNFEQKIKTMVLFERYVAHIIMVAHNAKCATKVKNIYFCVNKQ